jgi:hypothetical protein
MDIAKAAQSFGQDEITVLTVFQDGAPKPRGHNDSRESQHRI